jgi:phytoene synthase
MAAAAIDNAAICLQSLKEQDTDRYLASLLSPEDRRRALVALYAFHAELARVRDSVRDPMPGEVRLQYWRDLLEGTEHGSAQANPLAAELQAAIRDYRLPVQPLIAMSEARIFDLYDDPMESVTAFEGYAGETASTLIQMASLVLDAEAAAGMADAAGHAGVAQAVAGALLLLPLHRSRGQVYVPAEIFAATGLDRESFLKDTERDRIVPALQAFAGLGLDHLSRALPAGRKIPQVLMPAYLPAALARAVLTRAAANGATALDGRLRPPQWRRQLAMTLALWRRTI